MTFASVGCGVAASIPHAWAKPPKLATTETPNSQCASQEADGPKRCAPLGGFSVIDTKTEMSDFRMVVNEEKRFQVFLEPAGCSEVRYEAPVQWRTFDDQPFAVIQAAKCFDTNHAVKEHKPKPGRTIFVVRGLAGFEALHEAFDSAKNRNALRDASAAADRFLKAAWPNIEAQRVASQALEKQDAPDQEEKQLENKPLPASQKRAK